MIKTKREMLILCFATAVTSAIFLAAEALFFRIPHSPPPVVYVLVALACVVPLALLLNSSGPAAVDIWSLQDRLMRISGQRTPTVPRLTNDSVLYIALTAEELGEAADTMSRILLKRSQPGSSPHPAHSEYPVAAQLHQIGAALRRLATDLRTQVAALGSTAIDRPMSLPDAIALLDDVVDITVVAAGLAIASGLPARDGYVEVQRSNDSKKNPDTGVIDKHRSGKWIKGVDYQSPDLKSVIMEQWVKFEHEGKV